MKKLKGPIRTNWNKTIINSALVLTGTIASVVLLKQKNQKKYDKEQSFDPDKPVPSLPDTNPHESSSFFELMLSKEQYEILRSYSGNMLVFQFFYPAASNCGSPTLFAYNMKKGHMPTGEPPVILSYGQISKEPIKGRSQVLGDNQIKISRLDNLIEKVTGSRKGEFSNLIFSPVFLSMNPHIAFEVSVDGSAVSELTNPSPPG